MTPLVFHIYVFHMVLCIQLIMSKHFSSLPLNLVYNWQYIYSTYLSIYLCTFLYLYLCTCIYVCMSLSTYLTLRQNIVINFHCHFHNIGTIRTSQLTPLSPCFQPSVQFRLHFLCRIACFTTEGGACRWRRESRMVAFPFIKSVFSRRQKVRT